MSINHTPGPWRIDEMFSDRNEVLTTNNRFRILLTTQGAGTYQEEWRANARLIAAAPDLLAACKAAYVALPMAEHNKSINAMLTAAIAKAEGKD